MFSRFKLKRATQFTLFATGLMIASMLVLYVVLIADLTDHLLLLGLVANAQTFVGARHLLLLAVTAVIAFTVSSIIIENVLNPLRQMILKVQEIGEMNFGSPLTIDADDDELREYAFAFNTMAAKLNRYIEMQKRFVSDASHELATPITVINGHADLLLRHGIENNESSLTTIKHEILRMSGLVDSLLLLARSDNSEQSYKFELTDINKLILESIEETQLTAPNFSFETDLQLEISIRCDEYAIRRVMRILLSNAVKYAKNQSMQKIKITAKISHGILNISVYDNGIGIPPEHLPRIFERFYRVDTSRSRKTGSSGLGLAIAREIIIAHGGQITAASTDEGTEISFFISS